VSLGLPQLIYLALSLVGLGIELAKHGEPKSGRHDALSSVIASGVIFGILWWGGFFG
jgi:hypothetical protein